MRVVFVRNPHYYHPGKPYIDKINVKKIYDGASRSLPANAVVQLEGGTLEVTFAPGLPTTAIEDVGLLHVSKGANTVSANDATTADAVTQVTKSPGKSHGHGKGHGQANSDLDV